MSLATEQLSQWPFIIGAWVATVVVLAGYAVSVIRRGRQMSRQLPPDRRRWM